MTIFVWNDNYLWTFSNYQLMGAWMSYTLFSAQKKSVWPVQNILLSPFGPEMYPWSETTSGSLIVLLILPIPRRVFDLASLDLHTMGIVVVSYTIKVIKVPMSKSDFSFESFRMWKTQRDTLMQWGWPKQPRQILIEICCFFSDLSKESSATTYLVTLGEERCCSWWSWSQERLHHCRG